MLKEVEKELKYQISRTDFEKFKEFLKKNKFKKISSLTQINYYIDTEDLLLRDRDITVRIRKIIEPLNKYELTLKIPLEKNVISNVKIKNEITLDLDKEVAENIIHNGSLLNYYYLFKSKFNILTNETCIERLKIIGSLKTIRELYLINENYEPINIDMNLYLDKQDYEIEWETDRICEVEKILMNYMEKLDISVNTNTLSKNCRFFNKYLDKASDIY